MRDEPAIIMRRPDGVEHPLYGPNAAAVAARRIERDGWEQISPAPDPEPAPAPVRPAPRRAFRALPDLPVDSPAADEEPA